MPTYAPPTITTIAIEDLPTPHNEVKFGNINENNHVFPVLLMGSYTYCALSYDNRNSFCIRAYDTKGAIAREWIKEGARYLKSITVADGTVTFHGQDSSVSLTEEELIVPPSVHIVDSATGPKLPSELHYVAPDPSKFPIVISGPYRFWPASRTDGSDGFVVLVCDMQDTLLYMLQCPGAHTIHSIEVDAPGKTIKLLGADSKVAHLPWDESIVAYTYHFKYSKEDLLFIAEYFKLTFSDADAEKLAEKLPSITCATCCVLDTVVKRQTREKRSVAGAVIGTVVGGLAGAIAGFCVGGPVGAGAGWFVGSAAGLTIGKTMVPHSHEGYTPTTLEHEQTVVEYESFPTGPFNNGSALEDLPSLDFPRYQDAPHAAAVAKHASSAPNEPLAYSPATKTVGDWPRDPKLDAFKMQNGESVAKYIFVIIKANVAGNGYQMRINPEGFYLHPRDRINHSQLSEGYRFWCLVREDHMQVYAAGSIYVNATKKKIVGIDTRSGHYFSSFRGQDAAITDAAVGFLEKLGYDMTGVKRGSEVTLYLLDQAGGNM